MVWPAWLAIGTPLKFSLWVFNRLATWTGLRYLSKRRRAHREFWWWVVAVNGVSWGLLILVFSWLHHH
jgi:hypothetical protein